MKIFHRSLLREFTSLAIAICVILLAISLTTLLIRLLGRAASGAIAGEAVLAFLGFTTINYLPVMLSLTLFLSILMTLTRWYSDSEMMVWFSSGQGLRRWIAPVMAFTLPVALLVGVLSMGLSPWALRKSAEYQRQLETRDDVSLLAPGVFRESKGADRVFFIETLSDDQGMVNNVFVQSIHGNRIGVVVAKQGVQRMEKNGDKFLVLQQGRRYEGRPGALDYRVVDFDSYALRIEPYEAKIQAPPTKALPTPALWKQGTRAQIAELHWRLAQPISNVVLALLAIPLSFVNPRSGRSLNLLAALFVYTIYMSLLSTSQAWLAQGKIPSAIGLWPVHALMLAAFAVLFYRRSGGSAVKLSWRRPRVLAASASTVGA